MIHMNDIASLLAGPTDEEAAAILAAFPPAEAPVARRAEAPCGRCGGSGRITAFAHIQGGRCFGCS